MNIGYTMKKDMTKNKIREYNKDIKDIKDL